MFKVQVGKEVRIYQNIKEIESFSQLKKVVRVKFKECPESFCFTFIDDEGDEITVQSDVDLECFISLVYQNKQRMNLRKLNLKASQHNQVQQDQPEIQIQSYDVELQSHSSITVAKLEKQQQDDIFQDIQLQQFEEVDQFELIEQSNYQSQSEQHQISRIVRTNLQVIQQKILGNNLHQADKQIIRQEVQAHLDANNSDFPQNQIITQQYPNDQMSDIGDEDDQSLYKIVEEILLKQMPTFIKQLTIKTTCNVKNTLLSQNIKAQQLQ